MFNMLNLARARARETGKPWAVVMRNHGLSVMPVRLARVASVHILAVSR